MSNDSDFEIMFTWTNDNVLVVQVIDEDGSLLEYELDVIETKRLFSFLKEKLETPKKITKVLRNLVDTKPKKDK